MTYLNALMTNISSSDIYDDSREIVNTDIYDDCDESINMESNDFNKSAKSKYICYNFNEKKYNTRAICSFGEYKKLVKCSLLLTRSHKKELVELMEKKIYDIFMWMAEYDMDKEFCRSNYIRIHGIKQCMSHLEDEIFSMGDNSGFRWISVALSDSQWI